MRGPDTVRERVVAYFMKPGECRGSISTMILLYWSAKSALRNQQGDRGFVNVRHDEIMSFLAKA
jgi:hypothetical protein